MNLLERLQALIGHDLIVHMADDPRDEDGDPICCVPAGRLRDVGDGYFMIETKSEADGGFVGTGADWLVSIRYTSSIIHTIPDCAGCAVDSVSGEIKAEGA